MTDPPFEVRRAEATGPLVVVCDHASYFIPPGLHGLGLTDEQLKTHIGWDIGAAAIAEILSERFRSPLILCGTSRLVIDCNRQLTAPDLIPEISHGTRLPGNQCLSAQQRKERIQRFFRPYHDAIEHILEARAKPIFLSIHSMTDRLDGTSRRWPISFSSYQDRSQVESMLRVFRNEYEFPVGDNEPYALEPDVDYSTPFHAIRRGLKHLQVEFRQDLIMESEGQKLWANRFADAIEKAGMIAPAFN